MEPADTLLENQDLIARVPTDLATLLLDLVKTRLVALSGLNDQLIIHRLLNQLLQMTDVGPYRRIFIFF